MLLSLVLGLEILFLPQNYMDIYLFVFWFIFSETCFAVRWEVRIQFYSFSNHKSIVSLPVTNKSILLPAMSTWGSLCSGQKNGLEFRQHGLNQADPLIYMLSSVSKIHPLHLQIWDNKSSIYLKVLCKNKIIVKYSTWFLAHGMLHYYY